MASDCGGQSRSDARAILGGALAVGGVRSAMHGGDRHDQAWSSYLRARGLEEDGLNFVRFCVRS